MIRFKVFKKIKECEKLWKTFSPNEFVFDLWELRHCFFDKDIHKPYFIAGYEGRELIGILPLWYHYEYEEYQFFGGEFPERNRFFLKDKTKIKDFLEQIPVNSELDYIEKSEAEYYPSEKSETRYFIDFNKYNNNFDDYVASFSKKHRKNFRYDLKKVYEKGFKVVFNKTDDIKRLFELNIGRFKEDSFFSDKWFMDGFEKLVNIAKRKNILEMISIVDKRTEAVGVSVAFNGIYNFLMSGNNLEYPNIGKLLTVEHIQNALRKGIRIVDFCSTESGWKKLWNCEEEPFYCFRK